MTHFALSRNGEESLNKLLSPDSDPDHIIGPRHGYNTSGVKIIKSIGAIGFEVRALTDRQKCITLTLLSGSEGNNSNYNYIAMNDLTQ